MSRDLLSDSDFFLHNATVDARDLYKIKRGEKIKILESFREGKIYKVKLLKENARRSHYYLISDNLILNGDLFGALDLVIDYDEINHHQNIQGQVRKDSMN